MSANIDIAFTLNGVAVRASVPAHMSMLDMLRDELHLTGTKYGCGEGECGACTVNVDGLSVNSCLMFAVDCDGREVVTIEGLAGDAITEALKQAFVAYGAVQCGFCTPGFVMQARHMLRTRPNPNHDDIKRGIEGNLCRCTGYKKIIEAIAEAGLASNVENRP
ncbi:MAG: (2Fe-2S)-binding protein [Rhodoplanes sp.]|jgi:aerobic carbon-monoxide dehydrogenase small subunit